MEIIEVLPRLHMVNLAFGQSYVWQDPDSVTLIDTGVVGSGPALAEAVRRLGRDTAEVRTVVLTHFHSDHTGSAAAISEWDNTTLLAHRADAPIIAGADEGPLPVITEEWERELYQKVGTGPHVPPPPPVAVDRELDGGEVLDFGDGARVLHIPGHTDGSIAIHLPEHGVLFTGDTVANVGGLTLGVFNLDREQTVESFRRLAELDAETVCFGHGAPLTANAPALLRATAAQS